MGNLVDLSSACAAFARDHDFDADTPTIIGKSACPHFGPWAEVLLPTGFLTDEDRVFLALTDQQLQPLVTKALSLLAQAGVPSCWLGAIEAVSVTDGRGPVSWAAVDALYGEIAIRLDGSSTSRDEARALAYLVEGTLALEAWCIQDNDAYNYVPMGHVGVWWPMYLEIVDASLTPEDLRQLSEDSGGVSETESLSSVTPPDRLTELYVRSSSCGAVANPNLPASTVNENLSSDWLLLAHPNADQEQAWTIITQALENGEGEDLAEVFREFYDMRDDGWAAYAGFGVDGPHAASLRQRIADWCARNMSEDDAEEILEFLGIEPESDDEV